ncbi:MAG: hypothetical protein COS14_01940 [Bacteroidetes bacterium CG02_land_8_20_14_3_00_31_25]|nr:MAG: hypothetical protein COS14_01940 [Bacteroidetes bacterium CG02_land_8_20_14_3_00_31_25]PIX32636.1 MAG: hypothetical protein COZ59_12955 [Bacteroidetes bacterium CG_4_8_14_3_um_filter_31_14]
MIKGILYRLSPASKFGVAIIITIVSFLLIYFLGIIISISVFKWNILQNIELLSDVNNPTNIKVLKFLQLVQSVGLFIVPPFIFGYFCYPSVSEFLRINKKTSIRMLIVSILATVSFLPFSNWLSYLNSFLQLPSFMNEIEIWMRNSEDYATKITQAFLNVNSVPELFYNILLIAIIPALGEEFLFRGLLQRIFIEWTKSKHWGIWISALAFSAIHLQFFGFLPRLFLGLFFGYLLEFTGSLWLPILAHFINNLTGVLLSYFITNNNISAKSSDFGMTQETWIYGILGGIIGSFLFWLIVRKRNRIL